jgi:murein DD-endopeptidase MepM/ murein hydrolase activator NlpD
MAIQIKKSTIRRIGKIGLAVVIVGAIVAGIVIFLNNRPSRDAADAEPAEEIREPETMYGIVCEDYNVESGTVGSGQTLSHILGKAGMTSLMIDKVDRESKPVFDMRSIKAGQPYTLMSTRGDSTRLEYFIYEKNATDFVVVGMKDDSVTVSQASKEVTIRRRKESAEIESSLWNAMTAAKLPAALSAELEDIYGWSIDFFGLQVGDKLTVLFDERYIGDACIGVGQVWGAMFEHAGQTYYAIPFRQDDKIAFWDENGKSLRKQLLKAPLKFTRISSTFSGSRMHPVYKVRKPHYGVDYAAPSGTPIVAIADGTVSVKGWDSKGGGNILKIKHANNLTSGYLHLRGYAKGISTGTRVAQGQVIGYVGNTGVGTGAHLDFRLWKGTSPIDPLKAPSDPVEPIADANKAAFDITRDKVMAELKGEVPDAEKLMEL